MRDLTNFIYFRSLHGRHFIYQCILWQPSHFSSVCSNPLWLNLYPVVCIFKCVTDLARRRLTLKFQVRYFVYWSSCLLQLVVVNISILKVAAVVENHDSREHSFFKYFICSKAVCVVTTISVFVHCPKTGTAFLHIYIFQRLNKKPLDYS